MHIRLSFFCVCKKKEKRKKGVRNIKQLGAPWVSHKTAQWGFVSSAKWEAQKDMAAYTPKDRPDS